MSTVRLEPPDLIGARLREANRARKAHIEEQAARLDKPGKLLERLEQMVAKLQQHNDLLTKHFEFLEEKKQRAAAERFIADRNQEQLFADNGVALPPRDATVQQDEARTSSRRTDKRKNKGGTKGRKKLSELGFPIVKVHVPADHGPCSTCGKTCTCRETTTSYRMDWQPGQWVVLEVEREHSACTTHPEHGVWAAPEPFLLPGAMCANGLLAKVVVDTFGDHLPLNRQAKRMGQEGFPIHANVLSGWVRSAFTEARPLVAAVQRQVARASTVFTDDWGFHVQDGSDGKLTKGRIWVVTDHKQAFFTLSRSKEGEAPADLFAEFGVAGTFVADGGSEHNQVQNDLDLERGGCWSHLRRYFHDAALQHHEAQIAMGTIQHLFMIDRELVDLPDRERLAVRKARSQPLVDGLYSSIQGLSQKVRPKSMLGRAIGYAIHQERRMRCFLERGGVPLHNHLSELLLRQPIIGRKNYKAHRVHELTPLSWRIAAEAGDLKPILAGELQSSSIVSDWMPWDRITRRDHAINPDRTSGPEY